MPKIIEMVCTANEGRSPPAELVGRNYLHEIDADEVYQVASSGSAVKAIQEGQLPDVVMFNIIEKAKGRNLYTSTELQDLEEAIRTGNGQAIRHYFQKAADQFQKEEHAYRAEALSYFGIEGKLKTKPEQTMANPDTIAVLSMAESNNIQVQTIYESSGYDPIIAVLPQFATGDPEAEIPDAFGFGKKEYFAAIEKILEFVPLAVDKLVE